MLLNRGADLQARNEHGQTALDLARKKERPKTAALLRSAAAKSH
jgi:ankyrin repeat protein